MMHDKRPKPQRSEVAMWHLRSGQPDNVTDEGDIVQPEAGRRLQSEKQLLHATIARLTKPHVPDRVRGLARLAASYLLAGDVETARRYVKRAEEQGDE
jgi:hypothetical protein